MAFPGVRITLNNMQCTPSRGSIFRFHLVFTLSPLYLSHLSLSPSHSHSICLSVSLSLWLTVCLSVGLSVSLSVSFLNTFPVSLSFSHSFPIFPIFPVVSSLYTQPFFKPFQKFPLLSFSPPNLCNLSIIFPHTFLVCNSFLVSLPFPPRFPVISSILFPHLSCLYSFSTPIQFPLACE